MQYHKTIAQNDARSNWVMAREAFMTLNAANKPKDIVLAASKNEIRMWSRYQGLMGSLISTNPDYR